MAQDRIDRMLVQIDNAICTGRTGSQYEAAAKTLYQLVAEHRALEAVARAAEEISAHGYDASKARALDQALAALREVRRGT